MNKKIIAIAICLMLTTTTFLIVSAKPKPKDYMKLPPIEQPTTPEEGFIVYCDIVDGNLKALDMYGETTVLAIPQEPSEWIYVDDDGGADYTSIQEAIDNSNDGDTIYVYSGYYDEQVVINKAINLTGEDKQNTYVGRIQLGSLDEDIDYINVSGFHLGYYYVAHNYIHVDANNSSVTNCIVEEIDTSCPESHGIGISGFYNTISNNIIRNIQYQGIFGGGSYTDISYNEIYNIGCNGMHISGGGYGIIHNNDISSCGMYAIRIREPVVHDWEICYNNFNGEPNQDLGTNNYWHDNY